MKSIILLGIGILISMLSVNAQSETISEVSFTYDDSGNRIEREIVYYESIPKSAVKSVKEEDELVFDKELSIYPNPVKESLFVTLNEIALEQTNREVYLYDNAGRQILQVPANSDVNQVNVSSLPSGTYILKLVYGNMHKEWIIIKN